MDSILHKRLEKFQKQIDALAEVEGSYRTLDAAKENQLAKLMMGAPKELTSDAAKKAWAYATETWSTFKTGLAIAETEYNKQKHILELKRHAYQSEYLTLKLDSESIKKQV